MKKYIFFLLILIFSCKDQKVAKDLTLINAVPISATIIIETESLEKLQKAIYQSDIWGVTQKMNFTTKTQKFFNECKKIVPEEEFNENFLLSISLSGSKKFDYLLLKYIDSAAEKQYVNRLKRYYKLSSVSYNGVQLYTLNDGNETIYYAMSKSMMMLSHQKLLVEEGIRQIHSNASILSNPEFKKLYEETDLSKDANVFLQYKDLNLLAKNYFPNADTYWLKNQADWSAFELEFEKNKISLSGKSIADYTKASYLTVFKDIEPQKKEILQLLPASTSAIFYSAIGDIALYTKQYDRYLNARQILHEKVKQTEQYPYKNNPIKLMNDWVGDEMVLSYISQKKDKEFNQLLIVDTKDSAITNDRLSRLSFKTYKYRKITVKQLGYQTLLEDTFGQIADNFSMPYFIQYKGKVIFGNSQEVMQLYINELKLNRMFLDVEKNQAFINQFNTKAHLFAVATSFESLLLLQSYLDPATFSQIISNQESFKKIGYLGYQAIFDTPFSSKQIEINFEEPLNYAKQVGVNSFDYAIKKVDIVTNYSTKQNELLIQDAMHNIYLMTIGGTIRWTKKLDAPIIGQVQPIDIFNNGRIQWVFSTTNQLYIIDKDGNTVNPFPIKYKQNATAGVGVFDYDKQHKYRLAVPMGNTLVMYGTNGSIVTGFNYTTTGQITKQPILYQKNKMDYIITATNVGKIIVINRVGKPYFEVAQSFPVQGSIQVIDDMIQMATTDNKLVQIDFNNQVKLEDYQDDNEKLYLTPNGVIRYDSQQIKWTGLGDINQSLQPDYSYSFDYFSSDKKQYLSIANNTSQEISIYNQDNDLVAGFPVFGEKFAKIFNSQGNYYLFTQSSLDNSVFLYRIE